MDIPVILILLIIGLLLLALMNCKFFIFFKERTKQVTWIWWLTLVVVLGLPFTLSLLFNPLENYFGIFTAFLIWYLLPVLLLLLVIINEDRRFIVLKNGTEIISAILITLSVFILGFGFDIRATSILYDVFNEAYNINALQVSTILLLFFFKFNNGMFSECPFTFNKSTFSDALLKLSVLFVIIVPIGLLSGFLGWNPVLELSIEPVIKFLGTYLTIALPEELIMRAYIMNAWDTQVAKENKRLLAVNLLVASFIFGLSHWNNVGASMAPWYVLLATIAGIAYGLAWRKGELHEAMLVHTLVDWIWSYFFHI